MSFDDMSDIEINASEEMEVSSKRTMKRSIPPILWFAVVVFIFFGYLIFSTYKATPALNIVESSATGVITEQDVFSVPVEERYSLNEPEKVLYSAESWVKVLAVFLIGYGLYNIVAEARFRGTGWSLIIATFLFGLLFWITFSQGLSTSGNVAVWVAGVLATILWSYMYKLSHISNIVDEYVSEDNRPTQLKKELIIDDTGFKKFVKQFEWSNLGLWFSLNIFMALLFPDASPLVAAKVSVSWVAVINAFGILVSAILEVLKRDDERFKNWQAVAISVFFGGFGTFLSIRYMESILDKYLPGLTDTPYAADVFKVLVVMLLMFIVYFIVPKGEDKDEHDREYDAASQACTYALSVLTVIVM